MNKINPIKIINVKAKFNYVKTYKDWQLKICKLIKVKPTQKYWVELTIKIEDIKLVSVGNVIRFEDYTQSMITYVDEINNTFICTCYETIPTDYFQFNSSYFYLLYSTFSEK